MKKRSLDRYQTGQLVRSLKGRDKDRYYVIVGKEAGCILAANGTKWTKEVPKKKNPFHLQVISENVFGNKSLLYIEETQFCDRDIVQAIHAMEER